MTRPPSLVVYRTNRPFERVPLGSGVSEEDVVRGLEADGTVVRVVREDPPADGYGLVPTRTWERHDGTLRKRPYRSGRLMVDFDRAKLTEICRRHHIRRLAVFGSALSDDFDPASSDVDLLVEFELSWQGSLLDFVGVKLALAEAFGGREVDLCEFSPAEESVLIGHAVPDALVLFADTEVVA